MSQYANMQMCKYHGAIEQMNLLIGTLAHCHIAVGKCFAFNKKYKIIYMAKYSKKAGTKVERAMHEMKEGKLKSGKSGKKVTNPKQAIAIGLSEAREEGAKVPKKKTTAKK